MEVNFKTVESFALDLIENPILILAEAGEEILVHTINRACGNIFGLNPNTFQSTTIAEYFSSYTTFLSNVNYCIQKGVKFTPKEPFFIRRHVSSVHSTVPNHDVYSVDITFTPYIQNSIRYCCCSFKESNGYLSSEERILFLELFAEYSDCCGDVLEYDMEKNDFIQLYASPKSLELTGHRLQDVVGKYSVKDLGFHLEELVLQKYRTFVGQLTTSTAPLYTGKVVFTDEVKLHLLGIDRVVQQTSVFIGLAPNNRARFLVRSTDLTELRKTEMELNRRKSDLHDVIERSTILKTFFDNCPVMMGVVQITSDKPNHWGTWDITHLFANPAAAQFVGKGTTEEVKGLKLDELGWSLDEIRELQKHYAESLEQSAPVQFEIELKHRKKRKRSIQFEYNFGDPEEQDGIWLNAIVSHIGSYKFVYLYQDITSKKQLERQLKKHHNELENLVKARTKQLEDALEVKSRFLAIVSHEMRTPLSGVLGMLTLLSEANLESQFKEMVQIATVCGEQLIIVINDILDFSKLQENKMQLETIPFSLYQILEESIEVVSFDSEKKQLELISDIDSHLHDHIIGDAGRLRQILINLLSNAVKFSSGGEILLTASGRELDDGVHYEVLFSVKDQGIGISNDAKLRIFEPFQQADTSFSRKFGGSGLGLSISKRLAELMGGRMGFESVEGSGSTFYFTIRCKKTAGTNEVNEPIPSLTSKKILVVEPSETLCRIVSKRLRSWLLNPIIVKNLADALTLCANEKFEMLVIDSKQDLNDILQFRVHNTPVLLLGNTKRKDLSSITHVNRPIRITKLKKALIEAFQKPVYLPSDTDSLNKDTDDSVTQSTSGSLSNTPPVVPANDSSTTTTTSAPQTASGIQSLRILVAEDNLMNQRVIKKVLENLGCHNVEIVEDGKLALDSLKKKPVDIVLMDCMMPNMNGYEASERIRSEIPLAQQPLICALTANAFPENRKRCFLAGMNYVLTKPLQKKDLIEILNNLIKNSNSE